MPREILFNGFVMNTPVHLSPGLWTHPRCRAAEYHRLPLWLDIARILERGLFESLFIGDVLGIYDVFGGGPEAALRRGAQVPMNDPMLVVPAMAAITRHLGFGVTANALYEAPYLLARRFSTLDHLTEGRAGWNVVTGYLDSAARAMGLPRLIAHDTRYEMAEEAMAICYKLWEGSWEDGAAVRDRVRGIFADPARVHVVRHESAHRRMEATHLAEPSPQRTPLLYQAGGSDAGRAFAGRHAEAVFVSGPSVAVIAPRVAALRAAAVAAGRGPDALRIFSMLTIIVAETGAAAQALHEEYRTYVSAEGALALMSGWTGIDLSGLPEDAEIRHVENDAGRAAMDNITRGDPSRRWTVRDVAERVAIGGIGPVLIGDPGQVADALEAWIDATGLDGINLAYAVLPESFSSVVDLLIPELQRRGRYKRGYVEGTLREKLFGHARLRAPHPAAEYRRLG